MDYTNFQITKCPSTVYYISSFLSQKDEEMIISQVDNTPKPKWTQLSNRRVINYGGVPHPNGMIAEEIPKWLKDKVVTLNNLGLFDATHANHVLVNEYLPGQGIMAHSDGPLFYPVICTLSCGSHTILEFYEKDAETDGECTAATTTMNDEAKGQESACHRADANNIAAATPKRKLVCQLLIEPGSLLILKDDMYNKYLHSISEVTEDLITNNIANIDRCIGFRNRLGEVVQRGRRISLTIRHVPKTTRLRIKLGH